MLGTEPEKTCFVKWWEEGIWRKNTGLIKVMEYEMQEAIKMGKYAEYDDKHLEKLREFEMPLLGTHL